MAEQGQWVDDPPESDQGQWVDDVENIPLIGRIQAAAPSFRDQYIAQAQRGIPERIGDALGMVPSALGGLYNLGAEGAQGTANILGDTAVDYLAASQLPAGEALATKLGALGTGAGRFMQSGAEGLATGVLDIGEMIRSSLAKPEVAASLVPGLGTALLPYLLKSRTPSEPEIALAEESNRMAQLNAAAKEAGLVPSLTGQQAEPGVPEAIAMALGMIGPAKQVGLEQAAAKGLAAESRLAAAARAAETAAGVPPVIGAPRINLPLPTIAERVTEAVKAPFERASTNIAAKRAEAAAIQALPQPAQKAISSGIEFRDAELFSTATNAEKPIIQQMARDSEAFSINRSSKDPSLIVGNQVNQRIKESKKLLDKVGAKQGELTDALSRDPLTNTQDFAVQQMQQVNGLKGITVSPEGILDFKNTTLSGSGTKAERAALQRAFNDLKGRSPYQLDLLRKEIFNTEFGKIGVTAKNATLDQGLEALRQGAADAIGELSPEYRSLNQQYAQLRAPLDDMAKFFRNVEGAPENIQDLNASFLGRRLTSNAPSNAALSGLLGDMESQLAAQGIRFPISVRKSQDALNALSRYYDIAHDTSLAGQAQLARGSIPTSIKGALSKVAGKGVEIVGRTDAVRRKALKDLIGH